MAAPAIGQRKRWAPPRTAMVDWSHPLASSLEIVKSPGFVYGGTVSGANPPDRRASPFGPAWTFPTTTPKVYMSDAGAALDRMYKGSGYTVAAIGSSSGGGSNFLMMGTVDKESWSPGDGPTRMFQLRYYQSGADFIPFSDVSNGSVNAASVADGVSHVIVGTLDWTASNAHSIWVDGTIRASATFTGGHTTNHQTTATSITAAASNANAGMGMSAFFAWSRKLSDGEVVQFSADPYQMLRW